MTSLALQCDNRPDLAAALCRRVEATRASLDRAGFSEIVYEDFLEGTTSVLTAPDVLDRMNDPETSNGVVVFLRLVAAAHIKTHADAYLPFLDTAAATNEGLDRWVERWVEAMDAEADNVQIDALANALDIAVDVVNLDGTEGTEANVHHVRPRDEADIVVTVLYRPGHYDVLLY